MKRLFISPKAIPIPMEADNDILEVSWGVNDEFSDTQGVKKKLDEEEFDDDIEEEIDSLAPLPRFNVWDTVW